MTDVVLDPAVFYRLRWLQAEAEKAQLVADQRHAAFLDAMREAGIDVTVPYAWRNRDTTLVPPSTMT